VVCLIGRWLVAWMYDRYLDGRTIRLYETLEGWLVGR